MGISILDGVVRDWPSVDLRRTTRAGRRRRRAPGAPRSRRPPRARRPSRARRSSRSPCRPASTGPDSAPSSRRRATWTRSSSRRRGPAARTRRTRPRRLRGADLPARGAGALRRHGDARSAPRSSISRAHDVRRHARRDDHRRRRLHVRGRHRARRRRRRRRAPSRPSRRGVPNDAMIRDSLTETASIISTLTRVYAVSGSEAPMRAAVMDLLPPWAKAVATVDTAGNIIVAAGPERDTVAFVAHMDEIGFTVTSIAKDGTVTLANRGGFFRSLWEGQPAMLHVAKGAPLPGVFTMRYAATTKQPTEMKAWFGVDSAALVARGAAVGHDDHRREVPVAPRRVALHRALDRRPRRLHRAPPRPAHPRSEAAHAEDLLRVQHARGDRPRGGGGLRRRPPARHPPRVRGGHLRQLRFAAREQALRLRAARRRRGRARARQFERHAARRARAPRAHRRRRRDPLPGRAPPTAATTAPSSCATARSMSRSPGRSATPIRRPR